MDPVTHIVSGALGGRLASGRLGAPTAYGLCILAAWLPDVDNFLGLSPENYLLHHRGLTHSLLGICVQALLLAAVFRLPRRAAPARSLFLLALGLLGAHLWLDLVTTYGTQLLAPFDRTRFQWGAVFIIDPILTLTGLGLLLASLRRGGRRLAALGLCFMLLYPVACRGMRSAVEASLPTLLAGRGVAHDTASVTTDLFSPFYWKLMVEDGETLRVGSISILPVLQRDFAFQDFRKADPALLARLGEQARFFATWTWFARWPVAREETGPGGARQVVFEDARFVSRQPLARSLMADRGTPFTLTAHLDPDGNLTGYSYNHHGQVAAYAVTN